MRRINKNIVMAQLRRGQKWSGYICASNVNSYHVADGWRIGFPVEASSIEELNQLMVNYSWYNCNSELGNRVVCWEV